jgi:hypothetical protein
MHTISGHIVSLPAVAGVYILFTFFFYPMDGVMSDGYRSVVSCRLPTTIE